MIKRTISLFMALVLLFGLIPAPARGEETGSDLDSGMRVEGTNGFGTLLSAEIQEEYDESQDTGGYSILGLEITGSTATVEYASLEEAILVVALYSEDGMQLLASGKTTVEPEDNSAMVAITGEVPQYFMASAYLVDVYDYSPLCDSFDTPMYTQEMQELLQSSAEDYEPDRVLLLDDDTTTNFAVYAEDTLVIEEQAGVNTVASVDEETSTYVIENADESFTSLREGDIFAYPYGENEILIVKVASISVSGTTATITGAELELEEAFSHVKIETSGETADAEYDEGSAEEGVIFEGLVSEGNMARALAGEGSAEKALKYTLDKKLKGEGTYGEAEVKVKGSLSLKFGLKFSFYVSSSRQFFEFKIETELKADVSVSGKVAGTIPLPSFGFSPIIGAYIDFCPEVKLEFSGKISYSVSVSAAVSVTYENGRGIDFHFKPDAESELEAEGSVFLGIDMNPNMEVAGGVLLDTDLSLPVGVRLEPKRDDAVIAGTSTREYIHDCEECFEMELFFEAEAEAKVRFLKWKKLTLEKKANFKTKINDVHYSYDQDKLVWGRCPNIKYQVTIQVQDKDGIFISGAEVIAVPDGASTQISMGKTNSSGVTSTYITAGKYKFRTFVNGEKCEKTLTIKEACKVVLRALISESYEMDVIGKLGSESVKDYGIIGMGQCGADGNNVTWKLYRDGTLLLSGTGAMKNSLFLIWAPWYEQRTQIRKIIIEEGITSIGWHAFSNCPDLTSITIPASVTRIGINAFMGCSKLEEVYYGGTEAQWGAILNASSKDLVDATIHFNSTGPAAAAQRSVSLYSDLPDASVQTQSQTREGTNIVADSLENAEEYIVKAAAFSGLVPEEQYLLLAVESLDVAEALEPDNLLYIDQAAAGADGTLTCQYIHSAAATTSYVIACGASGKDLRNGEITFPEMIADGTLKAVDPTVIYENDTLTEGVDYVLLGTVSYTEAGTYTCFVRGIQRYTGLVECSYTVEGSAPPPPEETQCKDEAPKDHKCDVCGEPVGDNHEAAEGSHNCGYCGEKVTGCEDKAPKDHKCDVCGEPVGDNHEAAQGSHNCGYCGEKVTGCEDKAPKDHKCDVCGEAMGKHEPAQGKHSCDYCGEALTQCQDAPNKDHKCDICGETLSECKDDNKDYKCDICGKDLPKPEDPKPETPKMEGVTRLAGKDRLVTSQLIADQLKVQMGVEKFDNIIIASGATFADALPGSYLAAEKNAPILLTLAKQKYVDQTAAYVKANLKEGGTVYILGGESAVPTLMEKALEGMNVKRVAGADRFGTNLAILKEAGVKAGDEILVCTAKEFADSLSAAATGKPILLVYKKLTDAQKAYLATLSGNTFCVVGGTTAVPETLAQAVGAYGAVTRLAGKDRLDTSIQVARKYFPDAKTAVVAYGWDFPDGLCGGSLAYATKCPLILAHSKEKLHKFTADYTTRAGLKAGYVLGGDKLVDDTATRAIFGLGNGNIHILS